MCMKVRLNDYDGGTFIKIIREWTGLTQKEFAKALGRSTRQIQGYESGTTTYNIKTLENEIKKYSLEEIITIGEDNYKIIGYGDLETIFIDDVIKRNEEKKY